MARLAAKGHLGFLKNLPPSGEYETASLFGDERGKMFGVLEGLDSTGNSIILYAFSGQINGTYAVPGWAPPLFDLDAWKTVNEEAEKNIKQYTANLANPQLDKAAREKLKRIRKNLSRQLMKELHALYTVRNFRGETAPIYSFYSKKRGVPTGAGDCCAPKLLNQAQTLAITPLSMAEFYWGKTNRSKQKMHGCFYPACHDKCSYLMGFMLCGLEQLSPSGSRP